MNIDATKHVAIIASLLVRLRPNGECWEWDGPVNNKGYGKFPLRLGDNWQLVHRVAYEVFCGTIPKGKRVLHRCDNPRCFKPGHLFLGTQHQNVLDMVAKGRQGNQKLTMDDRAEITRLHQAGYSKRELAAKHGVVEATIYHIVHGRRSRAKVPA